MRAKIFMDKEGTLSLQVEAEGDCEAILIKQFKQQVGASTTRKSKFDDLSITNGLAVIRPFYKGFSISK